MCQNTNLVYKYENVSIMSCALLHKLVCHMFLKLQLFLDAKNIQNISNTFKS